MRISYINNSYKQSFNKLYNTKTVLAVITSYHYKDIKTDEFIKDVTGTEMTEASLKSILGEDFNYDFAESTLEMLCINNITKQDRRLMETKESYMNFIHRNWLNGFNIESYAEWFNEQLKRLGTTIDIKPFNLTKEEIKNYYEYYRDILYKYNF